MTLTQEMIDECIKNLHKMYPTYGITEESLKNSHWLRIWFGGTLTKLYGIDRDSFPLVPSMEDINNWKLQAIRKEKLVKIKLVK